ncbi:MAG: DUF1501 domain-containing protein [Bacteroidota bacterium]
MKRRDFLQAASLVSASWMMPNFLRAAQSLSFGESTHGKVLVMVQFSGGNDGLNMVVPYSNDIYYQNRPGIAIKSDEVFRMNDDLGLHPKMEGLHQLYDDGALSVVNGVGYPNPNRSHFRSMDIWHTASDAHEFLSSGWVGRYLDSACQKGKTLPYTALEIDDTLSLALKGQQLKGLAVKQPQSLYKTTQEPFIQALARQQMQADVSSPLAYLHKTLIETTTSASYVHEKAKVYKTEVDYPDHEFGQKLKTMAKLIVSQSDTRIYYVSISGFDTHVSQPGQHGNLLKKYSSGLAAFVEDLKRNNRFEDVMIMTFSEFGRRVKQNAGRGTDHGTANNVMLISGGLKKPGIYNAPSDLADLVDGDLKHKVDFREIYTTLLDKWLEVDAEAILGRKFSQLGMV